MFQLHTSVKCRLDWSFWVASKLYFTMASRMEVSVHMMRDVYASCVSLGCLLSCHCFLCVSSTTLSFVISFISPSHCSPAILPRRNHHIHFRTIRSEKWFFATAFFVSPLDPFDSRFPFHPLCQINFLCFQSSLLLQPHSGTFPFVDYHHYLLTRLERVNEVTSQLIKYKPSNSRPWGSIAPLSQPTC